VSLRIGSLFTGTGALDLAVMDVFDADVVWHSQYEPPDKNGKEDKNQYAARILARHWPDVPNLGDITKVDWPSVIEEHGPVDILTGGFPCQDVSSAGKRAGLTADSRSGLWVHYARAIHELRPRLVVIENVEGLLSAEADRGLGLDAEALEEEARAGRLLRALGAVLGDLATLGLDAEWCRVAASEVGAPHPRKRVFIYAWPAALDTGGVGRGDGSWLLGGLGSEGRDAEAPADAADLGHERGRSARDRRSGPTDGDLAAADTGRSGLEVGRIESHRNELPAAERGGREPAADPDGIESERRGVAGVLGGQAAAEPCEGDQRERAGHAVGDRGAEVVEPDCPTCGCPESFHDAGGFCAGCHGCTDPDLGRPGEAPADADQVGRRADILQLRPGQPHVDWGDYGPAIRRWEGVLGRPAPWPTDALKRLSPVFTEWLMGLPDGWVTDTPGLTRPAMLRALGNGVVPQQAIAALHLLHQRAISDPAASARPAA
jgi:DNA (cytosine-5)-methyltransferase 1